MILINLLKDWTPVIREPATPKEIVQAVTVILSLSVLASILAIFLAYLLAYLTLP